MRPLLTDLNPFGNIKDIDRRWVYLLAFSTRAIVCLVAHIGSGIKEGFIAWWLQARTEWRENG